MYATPPSPAAFVGRVEARLHPRALVVGAHCRRVAPRSMRCLVAVVHRDGSRRCASVHLTADGRRWLVARWQETANCAPLARPAGTPGAGVYYA